MAQRIDGLSLLMAATLVAFFGAGGLGLIVLGMGLFVWTTSPYRRGAHGEYSETWHHAGVSLDDMDQALRGPFKLKPYLLKILIAVGLIIWGLVSLGFPGYLLPWAMG